MKELLALQVKVWTYMVRFLICLSDVEKEVYCIKEGPSKSFKGFQQVGHVGIEDQLLFMKFYDVLPCNLNVTVIIGL